MQSFLQDLRFASRRLVKDRWFTLAAIAALALGIGANSAVFTLVNAVLLRGLPVDHPDRIMWVDSRDQLGRGRGVSFQDFEDWRAASRTFSGLTLVQNGTMIISADDRLPESYPGGFISANAFDVIGVKAVLGRGFLPEDEAANAPPVALISGGIWKSRYASDRSIIGKADSRQYHSRDDRRRHARRLQVALPKRSLDTDVSALTRVSWPAPGAVVHDVRPPRRRRNRRTGAQRDEEYRATTVRPIPGQQQGPHRPGHALLWTLSSGRRSRRFSGR